MTYATIYADPPWPERGGGKVKRGADRHYDVMSVKDIKALPVSRDLAADNSHLYLWVTNNYLVQGLDVMSAWGYRYVTNIVWSKPGRIGLGQYFRGKHEILLFGVRGSLPYKKDNAGKRMQGVTLYEHPRSAHSVKPEEFRQVIERVSYPKYLEMFARRPAPSDQWDVWGKEAPDGISWDGQ